MTKQEAVKYLQQIYPNGGHCWLDEQRIEAIDMAIKALQEEPVSEELEEAAHSYASNNGGRWLTDDIGIKCFAFNPQEVKDAFKEGANWQKEQFEKNRLAACDKQTEEEAEIEFDFVMNIIKNEHRQPTFDDAIKYGMKLQKEKMMAKAIDGEVGYWNLHGLSVNVELPSTVEEGDKAKVIVIKEK